MEPQHVQPGIVDPASWHAVVEPRPIPKYDNRAYLVAAYAGWSEQGNPPLEAPPAVAEQIIPTAYASGYRSGV